jgi:hypothetical protein
MQTERTIISCSLTTLLKHSATAVCDVIASFIVKAYLADFSSNFVGGIYFARIKAISSYLRLSWYKLSN